MMEESDHMSLIEINSTKVEAYSMKDEDAAWGIRLALYRWSQ